GVLGDLGVDFSERPPSEVSVPGRINLNEVESLDILRSANESQIGGTLLGVQDGTSNTLLFTDSSLSLSVKGANRPGSGIERGGRGERVDAMLGRLKKSIGGQNFSRAWTGREPALAFSADGQLLAAGDLEAKFRLWDGETGIPPGEVDSRTPLGGEFF